MKKILVYLPEELYDKLKLLAASGKDNFSDLIREGIGEVIKKRKINSEGFNVWEDFIGSGKKGEPKDLSSKIDHYLYGEPYKKK